MVCASDYVQLEVRQQEKPQVQANASLFKLKTVVEMAINSLVKHSGAVKKFHPGSVLQIHQNARS